MANNVNLPGWDPTRTDNDPKQAFGNFVQQWQASGKPYGADAVRAFAQQDPRWEIGGNNPNDPLLRVKQDALNSWKPGTSVWQDVIGDAGGQNRPQFQNAGGGGHMGGGMDPAKLQALIGMLQKAGTGQAGTPSPYQGFNRRIPPAGPFTPGPQPTSGTQPIPGGKTQGGFWDPSGAQLVGPDGNPAGPTASGGDIDFEHLIQRALQRALV